MSTDIKVNPADSVSEITGAAFFSGDADEERVENGPAQNCQGQDQTGISQKTVHGGFGPSVQVIE